MTDPLQVNKQEVVDEIRALFEAYETALINKDIEILDKTFWNSEHTIRYAMHENGYGFDEIHQHRVSRKKGPGIKEERRRLEILTLGDSFATVNLEFKIEELKISADKARLGSSFQILAGKWSQRMCRQWRRHPAGKIPGILTNTIHNTPKK